KPNAPPHRASFGGRGAARAHIVLRVHFEEADRLRRGEDLAKMDGLKADTGARRKVCNDGHGYIPTLRKAGAKRGAREMARLFARSGLARLERARALWCLDRGARSLWH